MPDKELDDPEKESELDDPTKESEETEASESETDKEKDDQTKAEETVLEKRYKDGLSHITKLEQENKELRDKVSELFGRFEAVSQEKQEPTKSWLESEDWAEKLRDDPAIAVDMVKQFRKEVSDVLRYRDSILEDKFDQLNPNVVSQREKIEELKKDKRLAGVPDAILAAFAEKMKTDKDDAKDEDDDVELSRGSFGGRRPVTRSKPKESEEEKYWFKRLGYDRI